MRWSTAFTWVLMLLLAVGCQAGSDTATSTTSPTAVSTAAQPGSPATPTVDATPDPTASPVPATPVPASPVPATPVPPTPVPTREVAPSTTPLPATPVPPTPVAEAGCVRLTDFASDGENQSWYVVNDNVMGGRSAGGPTFADALMSFAGEINTNGGGFSSVRVGLFPGAIEDAGQIIVRARGDGRTYKLVFQDVLEGRDRRISHQGELTLTATGEWETVAVSLSNLQTSLFGRQVTTDPFRPDLAVELGIQIGDGIDGPFKLDIDWIDACP